MKERYLFLRHLQRLKAGAAAPLLKWPGADLKEVVTSGQCCALAGFTTGKSIRHSLFFCCQPSHFLFISIIAHSKPILQTTCRICSLYFIVRMQAWHIMFFLFCVFLLSAVCTIGLIWVYAIRDASRRLFL